MDEVSHLEKGLNPNHPFIFILGGAKFQTKLPLIQKFMQKADRVLIAGALFNDILAGRGMEVGKSLVSNATLPDEILKNSSGKLIDPIDVTVKNTETGERSVKTLGVDPILPVDNVSDAGPSAVAMLKDIFAAANAAGTRPFVLWNGPLGSYEEGFPEQTIALAKLILEAGVDALIGGGDTTAAISKMTPVGANNAAEVGAHDESGIAEHKLASSIYISTGGGAMIDYLINETLPGIEALR